MSEEYKERVQQELTDLAKKVDALEKFTANEEYFNNVSPRQQDLLMLQARTMHTYAVILRMRLEDF